MISTSFFLEQLEMIAVNCNDWRGVETFSPISCEWQ